jgi:filamentous hemagglutinin
MADAMQRTICLALAFLLVFNPMAVAAGGIVVDPKAPAANQPELSAAPNGVPMVDIAKPSAKGLSHNKFDQFNVGESGVILNNSKKAGRTQLGGVVTNNPKLGKGPEARVILNEVTGSSRSRLEGYTEIFGYPADYILANPNGITVNGGGFINTPRAMLTTGKPRFDDSGGLKALDVRQGDVLVDGLGLNVSNLDAFDIISRTARINADVHASHLGITTGYGSHDVATGQFSALSPDGSEVPAVALDSTALGGMYAERIILVGNEKGVGVNLEGITHATDELVLTADGKIRIKGTVYSDKGVRVASSGDSIEISGSLAAAKVADVTAARTLMLQSGAGGTAFLYGEDVRLGSASLRNIDSRIEASKSLTVTTEAEITNAGVLLSGTDAALSAGGAVRNSGQMQAKDSLAIDGKVIENSGRMFSIGAIRVHSAGDIVNSGEILSKKSTIVEAPANVLNSGTIRAEGQANISAGGLDNADGGILAQSGLDLAVAGMLSNSGILYSGASSRIQAGSMRNDPAGQVQAMNSLTLEFDADLENFGVMSAGEALSMRTGGSLFNTGGSILAQTGLDLASHGDIKNLGSIKSGGAGLYRSGGIFLNEGEILTVGEVVFDINGDLDNSGILHSGGGSYHLGGDLSNTGEILSVDDMRLFLAGDLFNSGTIAGDTDVTFGIEGSLENAVDGLILASGELIFDVVGDLRNSGRIESMGMGAFRVGGGLFNTDGDILSQTALEFDVLGVLENTGVMHSGDSFSLRSASLDNSGQILAQGNSVLSVLGDLLNRNFLFSGGEASFNVGGLLHNLRGQILSLGDMVLEGLEAGSRMLELKNDSGTIETLEGSMSIRAKVVRNDNLDFSLRPGTEVVSRKGGIYSQTIGKFEYAEKLYTTLSDSSAVASSRDGLIITPSELLTLGFGLDRTVIMRSELDAAIAAAEARFALNGGSSGEIGIVSSLKSRILSRGTYLAIQHYRYNSKIAAYLESITKDKVIGMEGRAIIAASVDLGIEAESFKNSISQVSAATGNIAIVTDAFENVGYDINEHHTVQWSRAHANRHKTPHIVFEGNGVEVVSTPIDHAYGTISAGGKVAISADHVRNGIVEDSGATGGEIPKIAYASVVASSGSVIAPPRPESLTQSMAHIDDLIGSLPQDGLFSVNKVPGHRYLIETNPALTGMALFYGSDYFLGRTGIDLSKTQQQLLGDAFYETRLVREQIFALTGRRFLSDTLSSDSGQMLALMDNAVAAREGLNLSVGVALSAEQVAALTSDIVWLETRVVEGREVLVPIVYLCRGSLDTIARGGSVIVGRDVEIRTTGSTANSGVIKASDDLAINAQNVFNTVGTIQGDMVTLNAADSIYNTSGLIKGRDVSIDAGQDIISDTAKTTFSSGGKTRGSFTRTTSETVGQRGSIEATGDLTMQAGRDIGIVGSDVKSGGDATLSAGRNVAITAQNLESHSSGKTGKSKSNYNTLTSKASTVEAGGSVNISAGQDVVVQGSRVSARTDVNIEADRDVSITAATEGYDYYFKQKGKGGFFGGSSSEMHTGKVTTNVASAITAGGDVNVVAGKGGSGDLTVAGSKVRSGVDMSLKAADDVLVTSGQESASHSSKSSASGLLSKKSKSDQRQDASVVKSELSSGGDVRVESGTSGDGDIFIHGSKVQAGGDAELKSSGDLLITADQEQKAAFSESMDSGFASLTPSMKISNYQRVTTVGSEIDVDGKVALEAKKDVAIQASTIRAGESATITAKEGQVALLTSKDVLYDQKITQKTGLLTWKSTDKGKSAETVVPTIIETGQGLNIIARNGIVVEYKQTGDVRRDVELLAQKPGLEWMGPLLERDDIDWRAVQENFTKWNKTDSGLAPAATLVIAIAAAAATAGSASSLVLSVMGLEVSTLTGAVVVAGSQVAATSVQLAMVSALTAGITSLGSRLAVSVADAAAGGDLGKNLKSMVSEDSARSLLTTMVSAGVLSTTASTFASYGPAGEIMANTAVKTVTSNLVGGEGLEKALLTSLASSFASFAKSEISAEELDGAVNIVIAGVAGAASAAALGQDPVQGAMSAIVAELANTYLAPALSEEQKKRDGPMVRLADCNYKEGCTGSDGYELVSDEELLKKDIDPEQMEDKKSGFSAKVYRNKELNEYVIVFTGTDETKDWSTNFAQAFGLVGSQYKQAGDLNILEKLSNLADSTGGTLAATGHSLGGGLATAVASTGLIDRAVVFNTAGVHEKTIAAIGGRIETAQAVTTAYASRADILNNLQDIFRLPSALGTRVVVEAGGLHGIEALVKTFGPN